MPDGRVIDGDGVVYESYTLRIDNSMSPDAAVNAPPATVVFVPVASDDAVMPVVV